ncbi:Ku70-binding family protein [Striga hermonthica]|uniref:Mitochondrial inner membrane protease ATP23 n=1 Tax=Striga hermonthica TaxID=68872 RepID=A0A9N7NEB7_STRHE|nr:Ku70-binding family protein [Striga hermonthica]
MPEYDPEKSSNSHGKISEGAPTYLVCKGATAGGYVKGQGIRASHLSGDCYYKRELLRGFMKLRGHEQDFVRRRVMKSVTANPYCSEASAKDAMEAVWDICYNDTKPFDRAP